MEAMLILADAAQVANNKLYVLGGGWSVVHTQGPVAMALGLRILVPWDAANEDHRLQLSLHNEDGNQVEVDGSAVQIDGSFEVGRPPGVPKGTPLDSMLAVTMPALPLAHGAYYWQVIIDDQPLSRASFRVVRKA